MKDLLSLLKNKIHIEMKKTDPKLCLMIHKQKLLLIEIYKKNNTYIVNKIIRIPCDDLLCENHQLIDEHKFSATLKQICIDHNIRTKKMILISNDTNILMHIITVPKSNAKGISHYIHKQLSNYTLFSGYKLHKNWKILESVVINNEPHYRVVVLTCKSDTFYYWYNIFKRSHLSLFGITTYTAGLIHQFSTFDENKDKIIICSEPNQTSYTVWHDQSLQNIYFDSLSLRELTNTKNANQKIGNIINLLNSKNKCYQVYFYAPFLEESHKVDLDPLMVATNASLLSVKPFLDQCIVNAPYDHLVKKALPAIGAGKMTEEDLLIIGFTHGTPYFRLLLIYFLASISLISIIMLCVFFLFYYQSKGLNKEIQTVKTELVATNKEFTIVQKIDKNINLMKQLIIARRKLKNDIYQFNAELFYANLSTLITEDTRIQSFKINKKGEIHIEGEALRSDSVFKLLQNLKNSPFLINSKLSKVENNPRNNVVNFTITTQRGDNP